jgi:hypothetical protein
MRCRAPPGRTSASPARNRRKLRAEAGPQRRYPERRERQNGQPRARQRGRVSEVTVVMSVPVIRVRRRKPLSTNRLQLNYRTQRFMPVIRVRRRKPLGQ